MVRATPTPCRASRPSRPRLVGWVGVWVAAALLAGWEIGFALPAFRGCGPWATAPWISLGLVCCCMGAARGGAGAVVGAWVALGASLGASSRVAPPAADAYAHVGRTRYHLVATRPLDGATSELRVWASWDEGSWVLWDPPLLALTRPRLPESTLLLSGTLDLPEPWSPGPPRLGWMRVGRAYHTDVTAARAVCGRTGERGDWVRTCVRALGPEIGAIAAAALLGERRLLPAEVTEWFQRTGTIHLLAISGFHVSLLGAIVWTLARILTGGAWWSRWAALTAMVGYAVFVGAPISVVRALSMAGLALLGSDCGRGARIWNGLGWVTALMIVSDPRQPLQTGFALSISATAGVLLGARLASVVSGRLRRSARSAGSPQGPRHSGGSIVRDRAGRFAQALGPLVGTSLGATLLTTPWMLYVFAAMYPFSLFANLVAIPAMGCLLPAMVVAVVTARFSVPGAAAWGATARYLGEAFLGLLETLAGPCGHWVLSGGIPRDGAWAATLAAALGLLCVTRRLDRSPASLPGRPKPGSRVSEAALWAAVTALLAIGAWERIERAQACANGVEVTFLSVGQGDAILVRAPGRTWIVDLGPGDWGGRDRLVPHLRRLGIDRIDRAWISHGDMDHWGGLIPLLACGIRVDTLSLSGVADFSDSFWREVTEADPRPVVERVFAPLHLRLTRDVSFEMVHPWPGVDAEGRNDASIVAVLRHAGAPLATVVLLGDLELPGLRRLVEHDAVPTALILQAGHHGSRTSVEPEAYRRLDPRLVVGSLGRNNRFGFPHEALLEELERRDVPLLRTDQDGSVRLRLTARGPVLETQRGWDPQRTVDPPQPGP